MVSLPAREEMRNEGSMRFLFPALLVAVLAISACSAGGDSGERSPERQLEVRRIKSGSLGRGDARSRVVIAASRSELSRTFPEFRREPEETTSLEGSGTYLAVFWGEKTTGGYAVEVESAKLEGRTVTVGLRLREPPEGAIVTQAITYPYTVAAIYDLDLSGKRFVIVDGSGEVLGWPVERAS